MIFTNTHIYSSESSLQKQPYSPHRMRLLFPERVTIVNTNFYATGQHFLKLKFIKNKNRPLVLQYSRQPNNSIFSFNFPDRAEKEQGENYSPPSILTKEAKWPELFKAINNLGERLPQKAGLIFFCRPLKITRRAGP